MICKILYKSISPKIIKTLYTEFTLKWLNVFKTHQLITYLRKLELLPDCKIKQILREGKTKITDIFPPCFKYVSKIAYYKPINNWHFIKAYLQNLPEFCWIPHLTLILNCLAPLCWSLLFNLGKFCFFPSFRFNLMISSVIDKMWWLSSF